MISNEVVLMKISEIMGNRSGKGVEEIVKSIRDCMEEAINSRNGSLVEIRWISVDDDLPEEGKEVLVCGISYEDKTDIGFADFERSRGWTLPGNFRHIYFWSECDINLPKFDIKEKHNRWFGCPIDRPVLKEENKSFEERIEDQSEEFHREIGRELIDCLKRLTNGEI